MDDNTYIPLEELKVRDQCWKKFVDWATETRKRLQIAGQRKRWRERVMGWGGGGGGSRSAPRRRMGGRYIWQFKVIPLLSGSEPYSNINTSATHRNIP